MFRINGYPDHFFNKILNKFFIKCNQYDDADSQHPSEIHVLIIWFYLTLEMNLIIFLDICQK